MYRIGLSIERLFAEDARSLEQFLFSRRRKLAWRRLQDRASSGPGSGPRAISPDGVERRESRRFVLPDRGEMIAFVEAVETPDGTRLQPSGRELERDSSSREGAKTGRLQTFSLLDISSQGFSLFAYDPKEFPVRSLLHLTVIAENLTLDLQARVLYIVPVGPGIGA